MLDNIISINKSNDAVSRTAVRTSSNVQDAGQQPATQQDSGFSRHYESAQARSAQIQPVKAQARQQSQTAQQPASQRQDGSTGQRAESGNKLPTNHSSLLPVAGNKLPPENDYGVALEDVALKDIVLDEIIPDELPNLPEGVSISIEVTQDLDADPDSRVSHLSELVLTDEEADALGAGLQAILPGLEGMPESMVAALRNGGLEKLRQLVLADIERQAVLEAGGEIKADFEAEDTSLMSLLASLQTFVKELELSNAEGDDEFIKDGAPVDRNVLAVLTDDQKALLTRLADRLANDVEATDEGLVDVIDTLQADRITAGTEQGTANGDEKTPPVLSTAAALTASEADADADGDAELNGSVGARKPGSESSQGGSNANSTTSTLAANLTGAGSTNNLVTDEATLVRQPMDAAVVRENIARQDTEALIKQHLERELPVRNSATEVTHRLTERLVMMVSRDIQTATIRLDPPDLGKLDIRITSTNEQVQVQVVTHQPVVRDLLEQHAHRLREMLEQQGFAKVDVNVSDQSQQDRERAEGGGENGSNGQDEDGEELVVADSVRRSVGLVDHYV